jgi:glycerophosphoryl diester phosphodiesterase
VNHPTRAEAKRIARKLAPACLGCEARSRCRFFCGCLRWICACAVVLGSAGCGGGGGARDGSADAVGDVGSEECLMPSAMDPEVTFDGAGEPSVHDCLLDPSCTEILVCAHRGFHTFAPENSLPALRMAVDLGVDAVEMDIRETADDVLVLMHDDTVDRTTDGTGAVGEMTFDQVRALHLDTSSYPGYTGEDTVPTFLEALEEARGSVLVYIDMKTSRDDLLVADIQAAAAHDFVMVYSGDLAKLVRVQSADPDIWVFPSIGTADEIPAVMESVRPVLVELGGDLDPAIVDAVHAVGVKASRDTLGRDVAAKYFCDPTYWDLYLESGLDLLQTNWPEYMLPYVK